MPDRFSIIQSSSTISGRSSRAISIASSPSAVWLTRKPCLSKCQDTNSAKAMSSSTSSRCGVVIGIVLSFQKVRSVAAVRQRVVAALALVHRLAHDREVNHFGHIGGVVADPFEILGDEQQVRARADMF